MPALNRQKRQLLRRIQEHLNSVQSRRGAKIEARTVVDVFYHPDNKVRALNYVTPRRGVAWVPGTEINAGLDRLAALERIPYFEVIEGLFPPAYHHLLNSMGLEIDVRRPIMTYGVIPDCEQITPETVNRHASTAPISTFEVGDPNGLNLWLGLNGTRSPQEVERLWENVQTEQEAYFLVSDDYLIAGGAGAIFTPTVTEIVMTPTLLPYRGRGIASAAIHSAVTVAQKRSSNLIVMIAENEQAAQISRRLGFVDLDHIIVYKRHADSATQIDNIARPA